MRTVAEIRALIDSLRVVKVDGKEWVCVPMKGKVLKFAINSTQREIADVALPWVQLLNCNQLVEWELTSGVALYSRKLDVTEKKAFALQLDYLELAKEQAVAFVESKMLKMLNKGHGIQFRNSDDY